jgi:5-methylcytosine-specific restriction endonuclease McrA
MVNSPVLVLNQNYEPLNVCRARRAIVLLWRGKVEVLEKNSDVICSPSLAIDVPSVVRLIYLIKRPRMQRKLSRREVFTRDSYTCQYCSKQTRELTIDHVIPRHLGGEHVWENVVSACKACNQRKAGRSPRNAGMSLLRQPSLPRASTYHIVFDGFREHPEWQKYVPLDKCS